ncbi:helix-turn-helix transcriptional regulator, partial [Streptococcus suis]|nr:helix-turn-helix transcriptional regulator [Streptococcus suis]
MKVLLATRLKNRRKELGWSQKELAEGVCDQGQISRIEKGTYMPGADLLHALAKKLQVRMDSFFYHLSSSSRYLTKNILCLVIQIRKLFSFGLKFRVKKSTRNEHLMLKIFDKV